MRPRNMRSRGNEKHYSIGIDSFIERLKKIRALNCNPVDVGMDNFIWRTVLSEKTDSRTKFI